MNGRNYYIFGLQRSGTNFLADLIKLKYSNRPINNKEFWKHSVVPPNIENKTPLVLIHKNPYTWIESLCFRNKVDWIKSQKDYDPLIEEDEALIAGNNQFSVRVLAHAYNDFYTNWHERIKTANAHIIKYEDLLEQKGINQLLIDLDTKFKWQNNGNMNLPRKVSQSPDYTKIRGEYYKGQKPRELTEYQINVVNSIISDDVFTLNKYVKL